MERRHTITDADVAVDGTLLVGIPADTNRLCVSSDRLRELPEIPDHVDAVLFRRCALLYKLPRRMPKLTNLGIRECASLEGVECEAPNVTKLYVNDCPKLRRLRFEAPKLHSICIHQCPVLSMRGMPEMDVVRAKALLTPWSVGEYLVLAHTRRAVIILVHAHSKRRGATTDGRMLRRMPESLMRLLTEFLM